MAERILYQFTLSPFSIKVRKILDYKRLAYTTVDINPLRRAAVRRISGQNRVPVLVDGSSVISDSTRIAEYLERMHPQPPVFPREATERARVTMLEDWSDETFAMDLIPFKIFTGDNAKRMVVQSKGFYPPRWYYGLLFRLGPMELRRLTGWRRRGRSLTELRTDYERDLDRLDRLAADHAFLTGDAPTVFDFAVWGLLRTMEGLEGEELLAARPRLAAWYAAVKAL